MADVIAQQSIIGSNGTLTVVERLANLLESGQFADFTFKVGAGDDATTFRAHKMLLATASQPLHSLVTSCLQHQNGSTDDLTMSVTDIDPESFQHILKYIYTDDVRVSSIGEALNLMKYSEKWSLEPLGSKTGKFIHQFLDEFEPFSESMKNDLCDLLVWSEDSNNEPINKRAWEIMMRNINEIVPCQAFLNMEEEMVRKLITHPKFAYKNQLALFESIRDWGMNQILSKHLNVNQLQSVIAGLLQYINFKDIGDGEFASAIVPSECLGRADLIAFFLARGKDMPRDLGVSNSNQMQHFVKSASTVGQERACLFRKGYKLQESEVYEPHELRFRVDRDICLLGVGFGFLFSNVDMGVTIHCKGPWETRQWSDFIQTYCRVTWEQLNTTNVKLMFSEPVIIEANQSYKILAKIGRMSAGASDVEIWGGTDGISTVEAKEVKFHFLKNAVPPNREVEEKDKDNRPCLITDLIYQLEFDPLSRKDMSVTPSIVNSTVISPFDTAKALGIDSSEISSPKSSYISPSTSTILPKASKKVAGSNKENIVPYPVGQKPELPWLNRKTTIVNNREDKPLLSPFRKVRPCDTTTSEKVTLPWQRKSSIPDSSASFLQRSKPLNSYNSPKPTTPETNKAPWSVELRSKPTSLSTLNKSSESSIPKPRETPSSALRSYGSYAGSKYSPRSGLGSLSSRDTNKYSSNSFSASDKETYTNNKYSNPSSKLSYPSKDYTSSSLLGDSYSKRPSAYSSTYDKPSTNLSGVSSSYTDRSKVALSDSNKYSSPSAKPSFNSSNDNVPYRSSINRLSSSREPASRINDTKATTDSSSRYQRSTDSMSKYGQPSSFDRPSGLRNNITTSSNTQSSISQPYSSLKTPSSPYSSVKSPSSYSTYKSFRSTDPSASIRTKAFSPAPRYDSGNTSATSKSYPYSSRISSIASKWTPPSSGSSYYRR